MAAPTTTGAAPVATSACVVRPEQTEGPFFVDEKLRRADVRSDPADGTARPGVPLALTFAVSKLSGSDCSPLAGATVDIWHCDAGGVYSDVGDAVGKRFLRGFLETDAAGNAAFTTIYPGWYEGRTVHIHFKIRTSGGSEFTSQLFFDDALTDKVHATPTYSSRGQRTTRNAADAIFAAGGDQLTLTLDGDPATGLSAAFPIALAI